MLLDIPPLDARLPAKVDGRVQALYSALSEAHANAANEAALPLVHAHLLRTSGLLALPVPAQFGGQGASWGTTFSIIARLAKIDAAFANRLGTHYLQLGSVMLLGDADQQGELLFGTAHRDWVWASAFSAANTGVRASVTADTIEINGTPTFHHGLEDADRVLLSAQMTDGSGGIAMTVECVRAGIVRTSQRRVGTPAGEIQTALEFRRLRVARDETLGDTLNRPTVRATLRPLLEQMISLHVFVGIAHGALETLLRASRDRTRIRAAEGSELSPFLVQRYADLWVDLKAALAMAASVTRAFEEAWTEGEALSSDERTRLALEIAEARLLVGRAGQQMMQAVLEAKSRPGVESRAALERFWRALRAFGPNDPVDFRRRELGRWLMEGATPRASVFI